VKALKSEAAIYTKFFSERALQYQTGWQFSSIWIQKDR